MKLQSNKVWNFKNIYNDVWSYELGDLMGLVTGGAFSGPTIKDIREAIEQSLDIKMANMQDVIDMSGVYELLEEMNDENLNKIADLEAFLITINKEAIIIKGKLVELEKSLKEEDKDLKKDILKVVGEIPLGLGQTVKFIIEFAKLLNKYTKVKEYLEADTWEEYFKKNVKRLNDSDLKVLPSRI